MAAWDPFDRTCPSRRLLDRIGDKWTVLVIASLADGAQRYSELRRRIDGISPRMLAFTLRELEADGIVERFVYPQTPPRVEYALSERGKTLREPLGALLDWAVENMSGVAASRSQAQA